MFHAKIQLLPLEEKSPRNSFLSRRKPALARIACFFLLFAARCPLLHGLKFNGSCYANLPSRTSSATRVSVLDGELSWVNSELNLAS